MTIKCLDCKIDKLRSDFRPSDLKRRNYRCAICANERDKIFQAKKYANDPDHRRRAVERAKNWVKLNPIKERNNRLKKYGITGEQYDAMLEAQGGVCAICDRECVKGRLSVDHDHVTGTVRGLLCARCNLGLGSFLRDSPEVAIRAADYLLSAMLKDSSPISVKTEMTEMSELSGSSESEKIERCA